MRLKKMTWLLTLAVILTGLTVLSGCYGQQSIPKGWSGSTIAADNIYLVSMQGKIFAAKAADGVRVWEPVSFQRESSGGFLSCGPSSTAIAVYGSPAATEELLYIAGYDGLVYAYNAASGTQRWVYPRQGALKPFIGGLALGADKLYVGNTNGKLLALDLATGDYIWDFQTGDRIWATPAVDSDTVYIGSFDKKLYALDASTGAKRWEFLAEGAISATPLVVGDTVYVGSFDRYLYALNTADGSLKWKFMADNWFWATPLVYNGTLYAANLDGKVYILNASTGERQAVVALGSPISSSPVIIGDKIIAASQAGKIYAIFTSDNQRKQLFDLEATVNAPLAAAGDVVFVHTQTKEALQALDVQREVVLWMLPLK